MKRLAVTILIIALSLSVGVIIGYQIKKDTIYSNTTVASSHGVNYKQNAYEAINGEINSKIDSLFGHNAHQEIIIQVIPEHGGYSVEARVLSNSVLAKQDTRELLNNWISERMRELQLSSSIEESE